MTERTRSLLLSVVTVVMVVLFLSTVLGRPFLDATLAMTVGGGVTGWLILTKPRRPPTDAELAEQRRRARLEEIRLQTVADRERATVLARTLALELENDIPPSDFAAELDELSARTAAFNAELERLVKPGTPRQTTKPPKAPAGRGAAYNAPPPPPPKPPKGHGGVSPKPPPPPRFRDPDEHVTIRVFGQPGCVCGCRDFHDRQNTATPNRAAPPLQPDFEIIDGGGCTCHRHVGRGIPDCPIHKFS